jgi:hypothetical protein
MGPTVSHASAVIQEYKIGPVSYRRLPKPSQYIFLEVYYFKPDFCFHVFERIISLLQRRLTTAHREEHTCARHKKQPDVGEGY